MSLPATRHLFVPVLHLLEDKIFSANGDNCVNIANKLLITVGVNVGRFFGAATGIAIANFHRSKSQYHDD